MCVGGNSTNVYTSQFILTYLLVAIAQELLRVAAPL